MSTTVPTGVKRIRANLRRVVYLTFSKTIVASYDKSDLSLLKRKQKGVYGLRRISHPCIYTLEHPIAAKTIGSPGLQDDWQETVALTGNKLTMYFQSSVHVPPVPKLALPAVIGDDLHRRSPLSVVGQAAQAVLVAAAKRMQKRHGSRSVEQIPRLSLLMLMPNPACKEPREIARARSSEESTGSGSGR